MTQQHQQANAPAGPVDELVWHESAERLPDGTYYAVFAGVEASEPGEYGPGMRWSFEVSNGPNKGRKIARVTGTHPTGRNGCGVVTRGIVGRMMAEGERVSLRDYVGRVYLIVVAGGKVASVGQPPA